MYEMGYERRKTHAGIWLVFFLTGMLTGICVVHGQDSNIFAGIFSEYFLNQYVSLELDHEKLFRYIGGYRISQYALLVCCGAMSAAIYLLGALIWCLGMVWGTMVSVSVIRLGIKGLLICAAGLVPQILFYIPAFGWVFLWLWKQGRSRKKYIVLLMAGLLFLMFGILTEAYVNPLILQHILKGI